MALTEGGVVVGIGEEVYFAPAAHVRIVSERPIVTTVPGTSLGMALIDGRVVPVLALGQARGPLLLCDHEGETVALAGLAILSTGTYPVVGSDVVVGERRIGHLDVSSHVLAATQPRQTPELE
jgi:hypothetical protein